MNAHLGLRRIVRDETGAAEVIATIVIAPVVIAFVVLVFFVGRQVDARASVRSAAEAAAQAAARQRNPDAADTAARQVAHAMLDDTETTCAGGPDVTVALGDFRPGGIVTVTVTCGIDRSDLTGLAPPARQYTGTASAVIDTYRAGGTA